MLVIMSSSLAQLPTPSDRRVALRVTPDALRHVRAGHPWVFADSVTSVGHDAAAGDLAVVFDGSRRFAAIGLYDPGSPIRVKVLHAGSPARIDAAWWDSSVRRALERRAEFLADPHADELAYRVVNGENDGFPGLVVDRYAGVLVAKLYTAAWFPHLDAVVRALCDATGCRVVVVRLARSVAGADTFGIADGDVVVGELPDGPVRFVEHGLAFDADVRRGQKTGHFLDQRANRAWVGRHARGRDVVDVFASTGGFSVHAAAGGARSVHAIDLSAPTLAAAEHNLSLNADRPTVAACAFTVEVADAFAAMERLRRKRATYDLVVVDPPSFARRQRDVPGALHAYGRLTRLAVSLVRRGGVLVQASCSSRVPADDFFATVQRAAADAGHPLREIRRTAHDVDHPVTFEEGAYLKAGFWSVG
jgi:23S rRNA (cytosine1962-C5)-methyltransferase